MIYKCLAEITMIFFPYFFVNYTVLWRLLDAEKFPNLQTGKTYAYLEANMAGPTERRGSEGERGAEHPLPTFFKKYVKEK